jgi:hypothetical protein
MVAALVCVVAALLCVSLVDFVQRPRSRKLCVAVLYEDCIRCDNGYDNFRQTVRVASSDDVERLELAPYAGGKMAVHVLDDCSLTEETLSRLRAWAMTNGLVEVNIVHSRATLRGSARTPSGGHD